MKKDLIVTLIDQKYIDSAKVLFSSIYFNSGWKGDYMLLSHELPEKELKWFRDKGILVKKCKPLSDKNFGCQPPVWLSVFYMFTPEFRKWKNIIYLGADCVVRASLDKLTEIRGIAAVETRFDWKLGNYFLSHAEAKSRGMYSLSNSLRKNYNLKRRAFTPSPFVFSTDIIKDDTFSKIMRLAKKYRNITVMADESILNLFFYKKCKMLPVVYCIWPFNGLIDKKRLEKKGVKSIVIYLMGNTSKWKEKNCFYSEWKHNLDRADLIDLNRRLPPKKVWSDWEIWFNSTFFFDPVCFIKFNIKPNISAVKGFMRSAFPKQYNRLNIIYKKYKR